MGDLIPRENEIVPLERGEITAATVVGTVVSVTGPAGMVIPPSWRAIIGKHAKAMLEEGIDLTIVNAACLLAVQRGRPEIAQYIAGDLQLAATGLRMSNAEYEQRVAMYAQAKNGTRQQLLEDNRLRLERRQAEIKEARREVE